MDPLRACLLDLLYELRDHDIPLTVGGGYGLFLKRMYLADQKEQTLFAQLPEPRATNDIDVFLRAELLTDRVQVEAMVEAIRRLGYSPVEEAKFFQWKRSIEIDGITQEVKIDVLVGPLGIHRTKLRVSSPRVRPRGKSVEFHAHQAEEALFIEEQPIIVGLRGSCSAGEIYESRVYVPEAFPYLLMKLSAFADRKGDVNKDLGRHHALDAYTIVGMMSEAEYKRLRTLAEQCRFDSHFLRVCKVVSTDFAQSTSIGLLRLREHQLFRNSFQLDEFRDVLREVFTAID